MSLTRPMQTCVFLSGLVLFVAIDGIAEPELYGQVLILAPAVALLGLPHGALDLPMAEVVWPLDTWQRSLLFFAGYLGLAGGVAGLWFLAPALGLALFLAYSALHFSGDWAADGLAMRIAGGASAIGAPAIFHTAEVAEIFALLGPATAARPIADAAALLGLSCALIAVAAVLRGRWRPRALLELTGIWIGAALLPPLLYFIAYFCLLHSLRHLIETLDAVPDRLRAIRVGGLAMALTLVGSTAALTALVAPSGGDLEASILRVVFIGLAALTIPHMLLVERFERMTKPR